MSSQTFGLLGEKLGHSWSPAIHARLGNYSYQLIEKTPHEAQAFILQKKWRGLNVTIPYKKLAAKLANHTSPHVKTLGAANTLVVQNNEIYAENTDVLGFQYLLDTFCAKNFHQDAHQLLSNKKVLVLGTGGASAAVAYVLREVGARVICISRTGVDTYQNLTSRHADAVLLVNTTPVGMYPNCPQSPVDLETLTKLEQLKGIIDIIYNPLTTRLGHFAHKLNLPFANGLSMLVAQALYSSELFLGTTQPKDLIANISHDLKIQKSNICLIGMPGVGKTSVGRLLAHKLKRPFVDLDEAFELSFNAKPSAVIASQGEDAFRAQEHKICAQATKEQGVVIACGGGIVTRSQNYELLKQNGVIVLLERPLEVLDTKGRPLSHTYGLESLAQQRMPLYQSWADVRLTGDTSVTTTEQALETQLKTYFDSQNI